jgi:glyoxylase I family protein
VAAAIERRNDVPQRGPAMLAAIHEGVPVTDIDASIKFYTEVLGLTEMPRPDFPFPGAWLRNEDGSIEIHLFVSNETKPGPDAKPSNVARHTAFVVNDLEGWKQRLDELAVSYWEMSGFVASAQVFITDPDGFTIEFQQAPTTV